MWVPGAVVIWREWAPGGEREGEDLALFRAALVGGEDEGVGTAGELGGEDGVVALREGFGVAGGEGFGEDLVVGGGEVGGVEDGSAVGGEGAPPLVGDVSGVALFDEQGGGAGGGVDEREAAVFDVEVAAVDEDAFAVGRPGDAVEEIFGGAAEIGVGDRAASRSDKGEAAALGGLAGERPANFGEGSFGGEVVGDAAQGHVAAVGFEEGEVGGVGRPVDLFGCGGGLAGGVEPGGLRAGSEGVEVAGGGGEGESVALGRGDDGGDGGEVGDEALWDDGGVGAELEELVVEEEEQVFRVGGPGEGGDAVVCFEAGLLLELCDVGAGVLRGAGVRHGGEADRSGARPGTRSGTRLGGDNRRARRRGTACRRHSRGRRGGGCRATRPATRAWCR